MTPWSLEVQGTGSQNNRRKAAFQDNVAGTEFGVIGRVGIPAANETGLHGRLPGEPGKQAWMSITADGDARQRSNLWENQGFRQRLVWEIGKKPDYWGTSDPQSVNSDQTAKGDKGWLLPETTIGLRVWRGTQTTGWDQAASLARGRVMQEASAKTDIKLWWPCDQLHSIPSDTSWEN